MKHILAIAALLALGVAPQAAGQPLPPGSQTDQPFPIDRSGFALGVGLYVSGISIDTGATEANEVGIGLQADLSYGFTKTVAAFVNLSAASMSPEDEGKNYALGVADLGARLHLYPSQTFNPYFQVALSGQAAVFEVAGRSENLEYRGGGVTLGVGAHYALTPMADLDFSLDLTGGEFNEIRFNGNSRDDFNPYTSAIARLGIAIVYRP